MNKPTDNRRSIRPRRAVPLQPDAPGRGHATESAPSEGSLGGDSGVAAVESDAAAQKLSQTSAEKQKQQSQAALDNVREGYA